MHRDRNILSLRTISRPGKIILPSSLEPKARGEGCLQLNYSVGILPQAVPVKILPKGDSSPGCATSPDRTGIVSFTVPGSSRVRAVKRTRAFAFAFLRQTLAVALTEEEFRLYRKGTRLSRCKSIGPPGKSWYLISGRLNLGFGRWCVTHWQRTLGLDPRPPELVIKYPTWEFLLNYSDDHADYQCEVFRQRRKTQSPVKRG